MEISSPSQILITGIMASGKSTIAQRVAEHLPKSVHLRGDMFRRMIINGRVDMLPQPDEEALTQLRLRYQLAAQAADAYCAAGFSVAYEVVAVLMACMVLLAFCLRKGNASLAPANA